MSESDFMVDRITTLLGREVFWSVLSELPFAWNVGPLNELPIGQRDFLERGAFVLRTSTDRLSQIEIKYMFSELPREEQERAERFRRVADHDTFVYTHWLLRYTLGTILGLPGMALAIATGTFGKPCLAHSERTVEFNISHSQGEIALIFSEKQSVGIDLESLDRKTDWHDLAQRFFHPLEFSSLLTIEACEQEKAFVRLWTLKESVIKAIGRGLSQSLDSFVVPSQMFIHGQRGIVTVGEATVRVVPLPNDTVCAGAIALVEPMA